MSWSSAKEALSEIKAGRLLIVTDAADRENEGDLVVAAEHATPEVINFMVTHGRGLVCVPMRPERLDALELPLMVAHNTTPHGTAFTVPVDAREGTTTGISAEERATTIAALIDPSTRPDALLRPGHVFPLRSDPGGVLARAGHTEAAVDLAHLAGCYPAGVVCEILDDDGTMARGPALEAFAARHGIKRLAIADLIQHLAGSGASVSVPWTATNAKEGETAGEIYRNAPPSAPAAIAEGATVEGSIHERAIVESATFVGATVDRAIPAAAVSDSAQPHRAATFALFSGSGDRS